MGIIFAIDSVASQSLLGIFINGYLISSHPASILAPNLPQSSASNSATKSARFGAEIVAEIDIEFGAKFPVEFGVIFVQRFNKKK